MWLVPGKTLSVTFLSTNECVCWFSIGYNSVCEKMKISVSKVSEKDYNMVFAHALQKASE